MRLQTFVLFCYCFYVVLPCRSHSHQSKVTTARSSKNWYVSLTRHCIAYGGWSKAFCPFYTHSFHDNSLCKCGGWVGGLEPAKLFARSVGQYSENTRHRYAEINNALLLKYQNTVIVIN